MLTTLNKNKFTASQGKDSELRYPKRIVTLGICRFVRKYLLLRIAKDWKFCPGDWDFVISTPRFAKKDFKENVILSIKHHTLLSGKILKSYPVLRWQDYESHIAFILYPYLVEPDSKNFELSRKFYEAKWVDIQNILEYDRNQYLNTILRHTDFF